MTYPITNEVSISTPAFTPTRNTELSKSTQPTTPPRPQDPDREDLSTKTPLLEELTRDTPSEIENNP